MLVAGRIIEECAWTLKDSSFARWSQDELLKYLSDGQKEVARQPGAYPKTILLNLVEGTKQLLPVDTFCLVQVVRNWADGAPRSPVRITSRTLLDSFEPNWHTKPHRREVESYTYDERTPGVFFVYPPNDGNGCVECVYSAIPDDLTSVKDVLVVRDEFETALLYYVLYRAYTKDSDYSAGTQLATQFYNSYTQSLAQAASMIGGSSPNVVLRPPAAEPQGDGGD